MDPVTYPPPPDPANPPMGDPVYVPQPYPYPQQQPYGYPPYDAPNPQPQPGSSARVAAPRIGWVLAGTGAVALVAAVLPWAYVFGISIRGTDGNGDGNATLFFALVVVAMGIVIAAGAGRVWTAVVACVFSALIVLISLIDLSDVTNVASNDGLGGISVSVGIGLWLSLLAGLAALAVSIVGIARRAPRSPRTQ